MRMDQGRAASTGEVSMGSLTAATIVNEWEPQAIADVLWRHGEERESRRIARKIEEARPLHTTAELMAVLKTAGSKREPKEVTKRASRVFQARHSTRPHTRRVSSVFQARHSNPPHTFQLPGPRRRCVSRSTGRWRSSRASCMRRRSCSSLAAGLRSYLIIHWRTDASSGCCAAVPSKTHPHRETPTVT
mgnify:CR=1 FL=1